MSVGSTKYESIQGLVVSGQAGYPGKNSILAPEFSCFVLINLFTTKEMTKVTQPTRRPSVARDPEVTGSRGGWVSGGPPGS